MPLLHLAYGQCIVELINYLEHQYRQRRADFGDDPQR